VASSGLIPQPLWISVCSERRQRERMATGFRCQYVFMWMRVCAVDRSAMASSTLAFGLAVKLALK
jgi:hypothetical protein